MKDEEKIKKAKGIICKNCKWNGCNNNACPTLQETIEAIELGLAEGRKEGFDEGYKKATERAYERQQDLTETFIRDGEQIKKLGEEIATLKDQKENIELAINESEEFIAELKEQIEKMKAYLHSKMDFCTYCPLTNECENEEGTCPYAYATEEEQKNLLMDFIQKWELKNE